MARSAECRCEPDFTCGYCLRNAPPLHDVTAATAPYQGQEAAARRAADPSWDLVSCANLGCGRIVPAGTLYCCMPCRLAAEGRYEIDEHSAGCDQRWAVRQDPRLRTPDAS